MMIFMGQWVKKKKKNHKQPLERPLLHYGTFLKMTLWTLLQFDREPIFRTDKIKGDLVRE